MNKKELSDLHTNKVVVKTSAIFDGVHSGEERVIVTMSLTYEEFDRLKDVLFQENMSLWQALHGAALKACLD